MTDNSTDDGDISELIGRTMEEIAAIEDPRRRAIAVGFCQSMDYNSPIAAKIAQSLKTPETAEETEGFRILCSEELVSHRAKKDKKLKNATKPLTDEQRLKMRLKRLNRFGGKF